MNSTEIQCSKCNARLNMNTGRKALFCPCCGNSLYQEEKSLYESQDFEAVRDKHKLIKLDNGTYCTKEYLEYEKKQKRYKTWYSIWVTVLVICIICVVVLYTVGLNIDSEYFSDRFFYNSEQNPFLFTAFVNIYVIMLIIGLGGSTYFKNFNPKDRYSIINKTRFVDTKTLTIEENTKKH